MIERNLHLITYKNGVTEAEFMKLPQYGEPRKVRRLLTAREAAQARDIISRSDPYEIDNFCYSIA